jgi:hypothetical protein
MRAYEQEILLGSPSGLDARVIAEDYLDTAEANIEMFMRGKSQTMRFDLEDAREDFPRFWQAIGAEGDMAAALAEFEVLHNASRRRSGGILAGLPITFTRLVGKVDRIVRGLPSYVRYS